MQRRVDAGEEGAAAAPPPRLACESNTWWTGSRCAVTTGDGWHGLPTKAPFDAIYVGAAATSVSRALVDQLRPGGRMVVPVGKQASKATLLRVDKDSAGAVSVEPLMPVNFVPLVGSDG